MANGGIPGSTARFIRENIDSMGQLEILLLLHGMPDSACTAAQINEILRSNLESVEQRLSKLVGHGLIVREATSHVTYRYSATSEELSRAVDELASIYKVYRGRVIDMIYAPRDRMQSFSDAFRLKEDSDNNG